MPSPFSPPPCTARPARAIGREASWSGCRRRECGSIRGPSTADECRGRNREDRDVQLIVLGMHRSGTSTAARVLNLLGCHFGPDSLAVGANEENPRGFWERLDVVNLNDSLLKDAGAEWHSPLLFDPLELPDAEVIRFAATAGSILHDLDLHRPWFVKDPRLCLTLPLWSPLLANPLAVHVLRHPLEVAASLQARNALPIPVGLALWEVYVRLSLTASVAWPRVVVHHRDLISDTVPTVRRLMHDLRAAGVTGLSMPAEHEITDFVTPALHRQRANREDLLPWAEAPQVRLFHRVESDITALDDDPSGLSWNAVSVLAAHQAAVVAASTRGAAELQETQRCVELAALCQERERRVLQLEEEVTTLAGDLTKAARRADDLRREVVARMLGRADIVAEFDRERVARSGLFDRDWYLATYDDVAAVGIDPLDHYLRWGGSEGRFPGPAFDSAAYALAHPELSATGLNPLVHYLLHRGAATTSEPSDRRAA